MDQILLFIHIDKTCWLALRSDLTERDTQGDDELGSGVSLLSDWYSRKYLLLCWYVRKV